MTDFSNLTHADINWEQLWQNARRNKGWASKGAAEWDKKAASFASRNTASPYVDLLLSHLPLSAEMTVLDIGCGPGTLTLPIAERTHGVTALDFSRKMLDILSKEAAAQNITNIQPIQRAWEDDWSDITVHDIAIASRSMGVDNLTEAITKLDAAASRYVFIADRISPTPFDPEVFHAVGRDFNSGPDYIYTLNMLYSMGIHPNVTILKLENGFSYANLEQAFLTYSWMIKEMTATEEQQLKRYIEQKAHTHDDGTITIHRQTPPSWALIWWVKDHNTTETTPTT